MSTWRSSDTCRMWGRSSARRWPYVVGATTLVTGLPAFVAAQVAPSGSIAGVLGGLGLAVVLSIVAAKVGAALWMRRPLARDVLFGDLMLWEWLRRLWVERRLARALSLLGAADARAGERAAALRDLARLLEARDSYTHGHSRRVARHALRMAQALRVPAPEAERIWGAATVHDLGKLYTPREILNKPGRLTDEEFEVIKRHPVDGAAMLLDLGDPELVAIVRHHHERLDGRGYPDGLAGAAIPLGARIIAVADTFDALTSTRSYRAAASHKRALDILRKEAGTQLDAAAVAAFLRIYSGRRPALAALVTLAPQRLVAWLGHEAGAVAGLVPAAGWIAPAAAAAVAVLGFSSPDRTSDAPRRAADAAPVATVRQPSRGLAATVQTRASLSAPTPRQPSRSRAKAHRPAPKRQHGTSPSPAQSAPKPGAAATAPPIQAVAASAAPTSPAPGGSDAAVEVPASQPTVRDVVGAVKVSSPRVTVAGVQADVAPVVETVEAVSQAVATTVDEQVAKVTPVVDSLLPR
jgi:putative nucleotidyltransferase with HDIG domain